MIAWHVRNNLHLDHFGPKSAPVGGVAAVFEGDTKHPDNIIFDIAPTTNGGLLNPGGTLSQSPAASVIPPAPSPPDPSALPAVQHD